MSENWDGDDIRPVDMKPANKQPNRLKLLIPLAIVAVMLLMVAFDSIYTLKSGEEAVITRFGKYQSTVAETGLQFKLPFIESCYIVNVDEIRRLEFGFRSRNVNMYDTVDNEARMITGDENLVLADWAILYRVRNSYDFLFKVNDPQAVLRIISESSYRRVVASHPLDDILTDRKLAIQNEVRFDLQDIADKYEMGITIIGVELQDAMPPDEVKAAFLDVTSAKEEQSAKVNEASRYENEKLPMARGEAARLVNDAEAYKAHRINEAEGVASRYKAIEEEYRKQPEIMRARMYMEMLSDVLPNVRRIYIMDEGGDTLKFLPLEDIGMEVE
ncbi:MAG: FtsH protease activity modulator HflK [Oscillospiraceae bacterium]|nr:FtsH protease activity modulator HflK [Oscillospiraceae bacterium]